CLFAEGTRDDRGEDRGATELNGPSGPKIFAVTPAVWSWHRGPADIAGSAGQQRVVTLPGIWAIGRRGGVSSGRRVAHVARAGAFLDRVMRSGLPRAEPARLPLRRRRG